MGPMKEENIRMDSDEEEAEGLSSDESEAEDDGTSAEEVEEKEGSGGFTAERAEEIRPPVPIGEYEVIDDSARMYLQEIGRVPLLKIQEEKSLCRKIELGRSLERIEDNHFRKYKKFPSSGEVVTHLISQLSKAYQVAQIVEKHVGIDPSGNVVETIRSPELRSAIDNVIDPSLIAATAKEIDKGTTAAEEAIVNLSINSQLLPPQLLELLARDETSWQKMRSLLIDDDFISQFDAHGSEFKAYFEQIQTEARAAERHLLKPIYDWW